MKVGGRYETPPLDEDPLVTESCLESEIKFSFTMLTLRSYPADCPTPVHILKGLRRECVKLGRNNGGWYKEEFRGR